MRRGTKLFLYGLLYLFVFGVVGTGVYFYVKPGPSCDDRVLNYEEEQVDCGGPNCLPCEVKNFELVEGGIEIVETGGDRTTIVTTIGNLSESYGAVGVQYSLSPKSITGESYPLIEGTTSVPPGVARYIVEAGLPIKPDLLGKVDLEIREGYDIVPVSDIIEHVVLVRQPKLNLTENSAEITGVVTNNSGNFIGQLRLVGLLFDSRSEIVGASATVVNSLDTFKSEAFSIFIPPVSLPADDLRMEVLWEVVS